MTSPGIKEALIGGTALLLAGSLYSLIGGGCGSNRRTHYSYPVQEVPPKGESQTRINWRMVEEEGQAELGYDSVYQNFCDVAEQKRDSRCYGVRSVLDIVKEKKIVNGQEKTWEYYQLGEFEWITYGEFKDRINHFGAGLRQVGLNPNDRLAIYEETRMEWTMAAFGAMSQNITVMTVYSNLGEEAVVYALNQGETTHIITNGQLLSTLADQIDEFEFLTTIIYLDDADETAIKQLTDGGLKIYKFDEIVELGRENPTPPEEQNRDHLALIMYTSGSTGKPKGVMIRNIHFLTMIHGVEQAIQIHHDDVYLSFLPLAHILAFDVECALLCKGCTIGSGTARTISDSSVRNCNGDIKELRPTLFLGVPSILGKIAKTINSKVESGSSLKQAMFNRAVNSKLDAMKNGMETPFWDRLIFNKMKALLGGRVRFMVSGGAPLSENVARTLKACFGVPVLQGYGLTETCGGGCLMDFDDCKFGEVGPPVYGAQIKLIDVPDMNYTSENENPSGEILIRGNFVSDGYLKMPEKTAEDFDSEGWFHTGDIGCWLPHGSLKIIDRIKNLVKPPHGEYIAVENLESIYRDAELVDNICVIADSDHNELVAVLHPHIENLKSWASSENINDDWADLCTNEKTEKAILASLNKIWSSHKLKSIEKIRAIHITSEEWTPDNSLLTAAMKLKRQAIQQTYESEIESMQNQFE